MDIHLTLFIHSSGGGPLSGFHFLATMNPGEMNVLPGVEVSGHMATPSLAAQEQ